MMSMTFVDLITTKEQSTHLRVMKLRQTEGKPIRG